LPVTLTDETENLDAITFSYVAEELVEWSVFLTSQNMKVDAYEHVTALDTAVAKTKLFSIGMTSSTTLAFPLKYVFKNASLSIQQLFQCRYQMLRSFYFTSSIVLIIFLITFSQILTELPISRKKLLNKEWKLQK
jgi:hypothetical protein